MSVLRQGLSGFNSFHDDVALGAIGLIYLSKHLFQGLGLFVVHVVGIRASVTFGLRGLISGSVARVFRLRRGHLRVPAQRRGDRIRILVRMKHAREQRRLHLSETHLGLVHVGHENWGWEGSPLGDRHCIHYVQIHSLGLRGARHLLHQALERVLCVEVGWGVVNWNENVFKL